MLLKFKIKNYKSFYDEMIFSMEPAPKQKDIEYSVLKTKCGKALSSAVIYGANAAGKSNIIGAMDVLKQIIVRGHINNSEQKTKNYAANILELIPNDVTREVIPIEFSIAFIEQSFIFDYNLKICVGDFLNNMSDERKIVGEKLLINEKPIFERNENQIRICDGINRFKRYISPMVLKNANMISLLANDSLNTKDLFLTNGFKSIISQKFANIIMDWFADKFNVIYDANTFRSDIAPSSYDFKKDTLNILGFIDEAAQELGITSNHIGYVCDDEKNLILSSVFQNGDKGSVIRADFIESLGTLKFINILFPIITALKHGGTLVVDEFDNSLHPMIIMNIINIFHNDEININKAQLIFNTHNPIFLNSALFRRDEIKFVERDDKGFSTHYSLSDFSLPCNKRVRKGADYMKNYFIDRYGAIRNVDLSPIIEKLINNEDFNIKEMGERH